MVNSYDFGEHTGFPKGAYVKLSDYELLEKSLADSQTMMAESLCIANNYQVKLKAELDAANKRVREFMDAEKETSDAYLRIRALLNAYKTTYGGENRYEVTENSVKELIAKAEALEKEREEANKKIAALEYGIHLPLTNKIAEQEKEIADLKGRVKAMMPLPEISDSVDKLIEVNKTLEARVAELEKNK